MHYLAKFEPDGDGWLVTFPSVPEAITGGATEAEAVANAEGALEIVLLTYAEKGMSLPEEPAAPQEGGAYRRILVPAAIVAKIAFIQAFRDSGMTRVAFASRLGKAETEVRRMLDPYHRTKIQALEAGLKALGKRLVVSVEPA